MWFGEPEIKFIKGIIDRIVTEKLDGFRQRIERLEEKRNESRTD
jgi:uncharacterized protein (UPF0335 family)